MTVRLTPPLPAAGSAIDRASIWSFGAFGRNVRVVTDSPDLLGLLADRLPAFRSARQDATIHREYRVEHDVGGHRLRVNAGRFGLPRDVLGTANRLVADLQVFLAREAAGRLFVHAGVVAVGGRAVLIAGHSGSGKSTLVAALADAGAAYASDEFAVLDRSARAHPYARPLALRTGGAVSRRDPRSFAGAVVTRPLPVALVVLPRYRPGGRWKPRRLAAGAALFALMRHTVALRARVAEAMTFLRTLVTTAPVLASDRGDVAEVVRFLLRSGPPATGRLT